MHNIPKTVHVSWCTKDVWYTDLPLLRYGLHNLKRLNPSWHVQLWDDNDIRSYVKDNISASDWHLLENKHVVEISDLWRLILLHKQGGIYLDIDRLCDQELDSLFSPTVMCFLPTYLDQDFSHDIMISAPQNPIFARAWEMNVERRRSGCDNIYFLGPQTYMHAVTECLIGSVINSSPDIAVFNQLRQIIKEAPFLDTYREDPPFRTLIHRGSPSNRREEWQGWKDEMYSHFKIKHWTES